MVKQCSFEGCLNPLRARGYCAGHYKQLRSGNELKKLRVANSKLKCTYDGCENSISRSGYCRKHYDRFLRTGSPDPYVFVQKYCSVDDCGAKAKARGMCIKHWNRARNSGEFVIATCSVSGCNEHTRSRYYCQVHYAVKQEYGLEPTEYDSMLAKQNGLCAICNNECSSGKRLAVDHDHNTGIVRGLLCSNCNTSLGGFKDSIDLLKSAIKYLCYDSTAGMV